MFDQGRLPSGATGTARSARQRPRTHLQLEQLETRTTPAGLSNGNLLVVDPSCDGGRGGIIRIDPQTGEQVLLSFGNQFTQPEALVQGPGGDLFVVDSQAQAGTVFRLDLQSGTAAVVSAAGLFDEPCGLTVGMDGYLYVVDRAAFGGPGGIIRVDPVLGSQTAVSWGQNFVDPCGITTGPNGTLLVVDPRAFGGAGGVIQVNPADGTQIPITHGNLLQDPMGLVVGADGNLYVADRSTLGGSGAAIRVLLADGQQNVVASGGLFDNPCGIAVAGDGGLLLVDPSAGGGSGAVIHVRPADGEQTLIATAGFCVNPVGVVVFAAPEPRVRRQQTNLFIDGTAGNDWIQVHRRGLAAEVWINGTIRGVFALGTVRCIVVAAGDGADRVAIDARLTRSALLLGGAGDDTLRGGSGRDLLLGSAGADVLCGGNGQDVLVAESSPLETQPEELAAAWQLWNGPLAYRRRVGGLGLDVDRLAAEGLPNRLRGGRGRDAFFADVGRDWLDRLGTEQIG